MGGEVKFLKMRAKFVVTYVPWEELMQTVKRSSRKNKIRDKNIQELWSSYDVGPSRHLS